MRSDCRESEAWDTLRSATLRSPCALRLAKDLFKQFGLQIGQTGMTL